MIGKWLGAILVVAGCGGFGFSLAGRYRREEAALAQLVHLLDYMECELKYRLTPLPELFFHMAQQGKGTVRKVLLAVSQELEAGQCVDAQESMGRVLKQASELPEQTGKALADLAATLGHFDLDGQAKQIEAVRLQTDAQLRQLRENRDVRIRSYQTLGICAGAALAILFV